jgi:hypothetical protein
MRNSHLMSGWVLVVGALSVLAAIASAQDTSTQEERMQWVAVTHKLESSPLDDSVNTQGESTASLVLFLISSNFMIFPFLPFPACFVLHQSGSGTKQTGNGERERTEPEGGWQGVSESAVRAKRSWGSFGAQPARPETPVRAAAEQRPPGRGRSG